MALSTQPLDPREAQPYTRQPPASREGWRLPTQPGTPPLERQVPSAALEKWKPTATPAAPAPKAPSASGGSVSPWQAWNRQKDKNGLPNYAEWIRPGSAGGGVSYYQLWNRTGDWRPKTPTGGRSVMDSKAEASTQAQLMRQERERALNSFRDGQYAQLNANLAPAYEAVNQTMADRGIYNSTGAGTALGKTYNQLAAPIMQNITSAESEYADWLKNLGTQEALLYSQLERHGRQESRDDRAFFAALDQWNKQFGADAYNTLYAGALGRGQVQQDFNGIDFPQIPGWMTQYMQYAQPGTGYGPTGDAGEKPGTKPGFTQYNLKSYARERDTVEDSYRQQALALEQAREERQAKMDDWQRTMAEKELSLKERELTAGEGMANDEEEAEFRSMLRQIAWTPDEAGVPGGGVSFDQLAAFAMENDRSIMDYIGLLSPALRKQYEAKTDKTGSRFTTPSSAMSRGMGSAAGTPLKAGGKGESGGYNPWVAGWNRDYSNDPSPKGRGPLGAAYNYMAEGLGNTARDWTDWAKKLW